MKHSVPLWKFPSVTGVALNMEDRNMSLELSGCKNEVLTALWMRALRIFIRISYGRVINLT